MEVATECNQVIHCYFPECLDEGGGGGDEPIAYGNSLAPVIKNMAMNGFSSQWVKRD